MRREQPVLDQGHFGREFRRLRERVGLTQVQLAARLGYSHTYLSKIESGDRLPRLPLASHADELLNAGGALLALATNLRARAGETAATGPGLLPLPCAPPLAGAARAPLRRQVRLPMLGVTCPLHSRAGCTATTTVPGLADVLAGHARVATVGEDVIHGFAALLTVHIEANLRAATAGLLVDVEQTAQAVVRLVPQARGRLSVALLQLAARYAELAGWLRVERGQHGIGMMWLQRGAEWGFASGNLPSTCESLGRMSSIARLERDGATALAHSRAMAAVDRRRRWTIVESKLQEARAHAFLGDRREFERHSREAQRAAEQLGDQDRIEAPWLFGLEGETYIASHLAGGLRDLAESTGHSATAARAVACAEASLASVPAWMYGSQVMLTLRVADSYACSGDLDTAVAVARPVIAAATSTWTTGIRHELERLRARLGRRFDEVLDNC